MSTGLRLIVALVAVGVHAVCAPAAETNALSASIAELHETVQKAIDAQPPPPEAVLGVYGKARALLTKADSDMAKHEALLAEARTAPGRLAELKAEFQKETEPPGPPVGASLADVEHSYKAARENLKAVEQAQELAEARSRELERRIAEFPDEIPGATQSLAEARKQCEEALPEDHPVGITAAEDLRRRAELHRAEAALRLLETEREHAGTIADVVRAELALVERGIDRAQKEEQRWSQALQAKRHDHGSELVRKAREMQQEFADSDPALRKLCAENVALAEGAAGPDGVAARLRVVAERHGRVEAQLGEIRDDYRDIQERLRLVGLSRGIGDLLLEHRNALPLGHALQHQLAASRRALNEAQLRRLQLREAIKRAEGHEPAQRNVLASMQVTEETPEGRSAIQAVKRILGFRHELLVESFRSYMEFRRVLSETVTTEQELLETVQDVSAFVDEQVLWVPNMPGFSLPEFRLSGQAIRALNWGRIRTDLLADAREELRTHPIMSGSLLLALVLLVAGWLRMHRRVRFLGRQVTEHPPGTFSGTLETSLWSGVLGIAWPVLLWVSAWRLTATLPSAATTARLATALNAVAYVLVPVCLLRVIAMPDGLGAAHLKMDRVRLTSARKSMRWFILLVVPLLFVIVAMTARPGTEARLALGRLLTMGVQLIAAALAAVFLRRQGPIVRGEEGKHKAGLLYRRWWLWYPSVVALPLVMAGASAAGYQYSAAEIGSRIHGMAVMVLSMRVLRDVILRGLWLYRRQIVRRELQKSREAEKKGETEGAGELHDDLLREALGRVTSVSARTAGLVRYVLWSLLVVGLYLMWADVLPAFRFLDRTKLYSIGEITVSLADVLAGILTAVIAVLAVRNLPGMLETYMLSRSRMDVGERSALATLLRYVLTIVGFAAVSARLGIKWANVQWVVAALGVGLGFGLQEIVANLFSGLLLLLDGRIRPMHVVTVGDATGRVTSIRALATTVTDWNNKELIIPNKEFTTSRVVNWTLSERNIRLDIPVGIAYGSDTRKAEAILERVGRENEHTLDEPPVRAVFLEFGASSLDFQLRVYVNMEHFLDAQHELHHAIDDAFREAGITIAFPQLDVHLDEVAGSQ